MTKRYDVIPIDRETIDRKLQEHLPGVDIFDRYGSRVTTLSESIGIFPEDIRNTVNGAVDRILKSPKTVRIMEQGGGLGTGLLHTLRMRNEALPGARVIGYTVTAPAHFDRLIRARSEVTWTCSGENSEGERSIDRASAFADLNDHTRVVCTGADLHSVFYSNIGTFDIVYSDNTYQHLLIPLLVLVKTINALSLNGLAIIQKIFRRRGRDWDLHDSKQNDIEFLFERWRKLNPGYKIISSKSGELGLAVERNTEEAFQSNLYLGRAEGNDLNAGIHCVSFANDEGNAKGYLAVDHL